MLSCPGCSYWPGTYLHHAILSWMFLLAGNTPAPCYLVLDVPIGWEHTCTMLSCPGCSYWPVTHLHHAILSWMFLLAGNTPALCYLVLDVLVPIGREPTCTMLSCPGCSYWPVTHLHHAILSWMFLLARNPPALCYLVLDVPIGREPTCIMLSCPGSSYWPATHLHHATVSCPGCSYWPGTHLHYAILSWMFLLAGNPPAPCYLVLDVPIGWLYVQTKCQILQGILVAAEHFLKKKKRS
jgi:hypothetical protein